MSDKLRGGRVKVLCPKCEEIYVPIRKFNLDGAFFGVSLPYMFLSFYKTVIVMSPMVSYYEP
jgi:casein kinase II subunit beta